MDECKFIKGQKVECSDFGVSWFKDLKFHSYDKTLAKPFLVEIDGYITNYKYCEKEQPSKYKAYKEPKIEWLKEKKKLLYSNEVVLISSICLNNTIRLTTEDFGELGAKFTMEELFKECTELDGTPFGEEV